jgi:hypothetical protein
MQEGGEGNRILPLHDRDIGTNLGGGSTHTLPRGQGTATDIRQHVSQMNQSLLRNGFRRQFGTFDLPAMKRIGSMPHNWSLVLGTSLDLGSWCLELLP